MFVVDPVSFFIGRMKYFRRSIFIEAAPDLYCGATSCQDGGGSRRRWWRRRRRRCLRRRRWRRRSSPMSAASRADTASSVGQANSGDPSAVRLFVKRAALSARLPLLWCRTVRRRPAGAPPRIRVKLGPNNVQPNRPGINHNRTQRASPPLTTLTKENLADTRASAQLGESLDNSSTFDETHPLQRRREILRCRQ